RRAPPLGWMERGGRGGGNDESERE
ncbi:hypothetical protein A2U01_0087274, partial [Trifolium medium]|nr:hypothetical protein [Trifolium medium]